MYVFLFRPVTPDPTIPFYYAWFLDEINSMTTINDAFQVWEEALEIPSFFNYFANISGCSNKEGSFIFLILYI